MRRLLIAAALAAASVSAGGAALAQWSQNDQTQACYAEARRLALQGEALSDFMADCTSDRVAMAPDDRADLWQRCQERTRLLTGEEKKMAMRDCTRR